MAGHAERFASGEESEWHADLEHLRDISVMLRMGMLASMQDDLQGYRAWWNAMDALHRILTSYCDPREREELEAARAPPVPDPHTVQRLRVTVHLSEYRVRIGRWEEACRKVIVRKGFAIRAREGDTEEIDLALFRKKSGLT